MYINIGLTVLSKNKNFFIALVESFIIITVFCEKTPYNIANFGMILNALYINNNVTPNEEKGIEKPYYKIDSVPPIEILNNLGNNAINE